MSSTITRIIPISRTSIDCRPKQESTGFISGKLREYHLDRQAIVYVRQSTAQQIIDHQESTMRQYALADRAVALGWARERVLVIDDDQGQSGQSVEGRIGFQRLLAEIGLDRVGLILGLEMSRLARSCKDWHQLLELCAIFRTLLADQDGLYDPTDFNDRLLLGLKGTMSEAELHILKGRMYQGRMNKARRGELVVTAPIGYIKSAEGGLILDPDEQVQSVVRLIFTEFPRQGSLYSLLKYLAKNQISMPVRPVHGVNRGNLEWRRPCRETLLSMLHHPVYAGCYRYGHRQTDLRKKVPGRRSTGRSIHRPEDCPVLIRDRLPAYITWDDFQKVQEMLAQNRARATSQGAPRSGQSLLGGLVYCARCGERLMVQYCGNSNRLRYQCGRASQNYGQDLCIGVTGHDLDDFVTDRIFKVLAPASINLSIAASNDVQNERRRLNEHWNQRLERAKQKVTRAERQYQSVEPENRLVARTLERQWEESLLEHEQLIGEYGEFQNEKPLCLSSQELESVKSLSTRIPDLWHSPSTNPKDRQRIARMLIDRITINVQGERLDVTINWVGGYVSSHEARRNVHSYSQVSNLKQLLNRIVELRSEGRKHVEIASLVNQEGYHPPKHRNEFTAQAISRLLIKYGDSPNSRIDSSATHSSLVSNEWWLPALARQVGVPAATLANWLRSGYVNGRKVNIANGRWILWADETEIDRLRKLYAHRRGWSDSPYPAELTTPKSRPIN